MVKVNDLVPMYVSRSARIRQLERDIARADCAKRDAMAISLRQRKRLTLLRLELAKLTKER